VNQTETPVLGPEEQFLLKRYGDNIAGLIKYGSMAFGEPYRRSVHDFWVIVRDLHAFHSLNAEFYRTRLNHPSTVEKQVEANRFAPNFYSIHEDGLAIKAAVIAEHDFDRLCHARLMFVKGRMQKPLRIIRSTPRIDRAISDARREGAYHALNLCRRQFTLDEFLYQLCSLSYRAEIRPEHKHAKIMSIINSGGAMFRGIYADILATIPTLTFDGRTYSDTRTRQERVLARRRTLGYIRRCKWSWNTIKLIWRNYRTHSAPLRYLWDKITGEIEKALRRRRRASAPPSR